MTLLTCMQTSSTMSMCIININNDHDHDPASPPLPPHLSSNNNNNNGRYLTTTTTRTSSIDSGKRARDVTCLKSLGMFFYFSLFELTTDEYIYFRLLTTTQRLPRHRGGDVATVSDAIELRGNDRFEKWQGEGMGLETRLVSSPWYVFFSFLLEYTDT